MSSLKGVGITKGVTGANSTAPNTSASILIGNFGEVGTTFKNNEVYTITKLKEIEELGITPANDIANDIVCHRHILDFYSMAGEGTTLIVVSVDADTPSTALEDVDVSFCKKIVAAAKGKIRQLGFAWNIEAGANELKVDGLSSLIRAAIAKAQLFADWSFETNRPLHVLLEGRAISNSLSSLLNLRNITTNDVVLDAPQVSIVIGQDWDYAEARKTAAGVPAGSLVHLYAAVGKALGTVAAAEMNQSIAEVASFNLSDAKRGYFITAGLSNHKKIEELEADLESLDTKGYIFPIQFSTTAISGYRWNNDHTCVEIRVDAEGNVNEHMIYFSRTLNELSRSLRDRLLVSLKKRFPANAETGKLTTGSVKLLETEGDEVFDLYKNAGFISEGKTIIDADSDLITPPKTLFVEFDAVPVLILDNISGVVRMKKSLTV